MLIYDDVCTWYNCITKTLRARAKTNYYGNKVAVLCKEPSYQVGH